LEAFPFRNSKHLFLASTAQNFNYFNTCRILLKKTYSPSLTQVLCIIEYLTQKTHCSNSKVFFGLQSCAPLSRHLPSDIEFSSQLCNPNLIHCKMENWSEFRKGTLQLIISVCLHIWQNSEFLPNFNSISEIWPMYFALLYGNELKMYHK